MSEDAGSVVDRLRAAGSVFAEQEACLLLSVFTGAALDGAVARRIGGEPLEHVVGWADFAGVRVVVRPPVFVPRRRAEAIVERAEALLTTLPSDAFVVDVACGSGALAAALRSRHPSLRCHATDLDPEAVACAKENADRFGFVVHQGSWFAALPTHLRGEVDLVVGHLPYVPTHDLALLPRDYRDAERTASVDGGADGLDPLRAVLAELPQWLQPGGAFVTQVSTSQVSRAEDLIRRTGLAARRHGDPDAPVLSALLSSGRLRPKQPLRGTGPS